MNYLPHSICLNDDGGIILLLAVSNGAIALCYFAIPALLLQIASRRGINMPAPILWLFVAFISLCGASHLLEVLTLWVPAYYLEGAADALTAIASAATVVFLVSVLLVQKNGKP